MTDRSSGSERPPRPDEVRQSLRALADGSVPPRDPEDGTTPPDAVSIDPESVVADAERAVRCAREAAAFLSAGRLPDLDRAVATAARRGDDDVAARGRAARESLRRLDDAVHGKETTELLDSAGSSRSGGDRESRPDDADPSRNVDPAADPAVDPRERDDHFRSGRGTVLGDTAQGSHR